MPQTWEEEEDEGNSLLCNLGGLGPSPPPFPFPATPAGLPVSGIEPNSSSDAADPELSLACSDVGDSAVIAGISEAGVTNAEQTVSSLINGSLGSSHENLQ